MPDNMFNIGIRYYTVLCYWCQLSLTLCCKNNLVLIEYSPDKKLFATILNILTVSDK